MKLSSIINEPDGMEAYIWPNPDGVRYNVVLRDIDADDTVKVIITANYDKAIKMMHSVMYPD
jgi:hypothetical protein|tara:strand:+ start:123 stop:308 length:186 start_codon:yes stop_codon:yes gene_type:complete